MRLIDMLMRGPVIDSDTVVEDRTRRYTADKAKTKERVLREVPGLVGEEWVSSRILSKKLDVPTIALGWMLKPFVDDGTFEKQRKGDGISSYRRKKACQET